MFSVKFLSFVTSSWQNESIRLYSEHDAHRLAREKSRQFIDVPFTVFNEGDHKFDGIYLNGVQYVRE